MEHQKIGKCSGKKKKISNRDIPQRYRSKLKVFPQARAGTI